MPAVRVGAPSRVRHGIGIGWALTWVMNMGRECGGSEKQAKSTKHSMEYLDGVRLSRAEVETEGRGGP